MTQANDPLLPPEDSGRKGARGTVVRAVALLVPVSLLLCLIAWLAWVAGWSWVQ